MGTKAFGIDQEILEGYAAEIRHVVDAGMELAIVIGGGNIFRGVNNATKGMTRSHADYGYAGDHDQCNGPSGCS